MRIALIVLSFLAFASTGYAIDNSDCPTGRSGQAAATAQNMYDVMAKGTRWHNPGHQKERGIIMVAPASFKLDYKGQGKNKVREILIEQDIGNTKFKGALVVDGKLRVELDQIFFTIYKGRCTLVTRTNPNEYHPSTANYPYSDMKHHKIQRNGKLVKPIIGGVHVLREYYWSRD